MSIFGPKIENTQQLAAETLEKMRKGRWGRTPTETDKVEQGDRFVDEMGQYRPSPLEQGVARLTAEAVKQVGSTAGKVALYQASLEVLSRGVSGSIGGVMAGIAASVLQGGALQGDEARKVGASLLSGIARDSSSETEKALSSKMADVSAPLPAAAQAALNRATLANLTQEPGPVSGPLLATIGTQALGPSPSLDAAQQAAVGTRIIETIRTLPTATAADKAVAALADGRGVPASAQQALTQAALQAVSVGVSLWNGKAFAGTAENAMSLAASAPPADRAALGLVLLDRMATSPDLGDDQKTFADSVKQAIAPLATSVQLTTVSAALSTISRGDVPRNGQQEAAFGARAMTQAGSAAPAERAALGRALLATLATSPNASVDDKAFAGLVGGLSEGMPDVAKGLVLQSGLQSLAQGAPPMTVQGLAKFGGEVMAAARASQPAERAAIAGAALSAVRGLSCISEMEKTYVSVVQEACGLSAADGQIALVESALGALSKGEVTSVGKALATLTKQVKPQPAVAGALLAGVASASDDPGEKLLAGLAAQAAATLPASVGGAATQATLDVLSAGASKSNEALVGEVGKAAMALAAKATPQERIQLGGVYLNALSRESTNPAAQSLCRVASDICANQKSPAAGMAVIEAALATASKAETHETGPMLANVGLELMKTVGQAKDSEADQRALAVSFLAGITRESAVPAEQSLSRLVSPLCGYLEPKTGLDLARTALEALQAGESATAKVGAQALQHVDAAHTSDRVSIASAFVQQISDDEQADAAVRDAARRHLADAALFRTDGAFAAVLGSFLATTAGLEPDHAALDAATQAELQSLRQSVHDDIVASWQGRLDERLWESVDRGDVPAPDTLGSATLEEAWPEIEARFDAEIAQHPLLSQTSAEQRQAVLGQESWKTWAAESRTGLTFGETFPEVSLPPIHWAGANEAEQKNRQAIIEKLAKTESPADGRDKHLLQQALNALPLSILQDLDRYKYDVSVTRHRVSNAHDPLQGRLNTAGSLHDMDDGAVVIEQGKAPRILVRSRWKDGRLQIDPDSFLREIAHAYDKHLYGNNRPNQNQYLVAAFNAEHQQLPARFHTAPEFLAEMWSRYQLDPERCARQFPQTFAAFEGGFFGKHKVDPRLLAEMQPVTPPVANVSGDPFAEIRAIEALGQVQRSRGLRTIPYVLEIKGETQHNVNTLVSRLGEELRAVRSPGHPRWSDDEGVMRVSAATFNNPDELEKVCNQLIQGGRGTFLVLNELGQIQAGSPGFATLQKFIDRFGGQIPVIMQGTASDLDRFKNVLPTVTHKRFDMAPLTASMITDLVNHTARAEGYELSTEAVRAMAGRARDGELAQSFMLWRGIKSAQTERNAQLLPYLQAEPNAVTRVVVNDVQNARLSKEKDPLEELNRLTGLAGAKRELRNVLGQVKLQKLQHEYGMTSDPPRLNLLFEGNPGTGKTTVAKLFADALTRVGYLKNNKFVEVRIQDLLTGGMPEENVKKLFEQNKGGVIFIDEMHQLKDTQEGRLAFRAMIPYLGHPEYADTVFIGAGYKDEMRDLVRDIDAGAERRFTSVPFEDYSRPELGHILDKMAADRQRVLDEPTREAALMRLERERRRMKNFGNAGSVQSLLDIAVKKQTTRLSEQQGVISKAELQTLAADDFAAEKTLTPAEVWQEIDALEGLEDLKAGLRTICSSIEYDREMGKDPLESFEPYFILDGPPGTGKTTMARLIVKLMAAYDIIPSAGLSESQGADLQAGYVGQTTTKVQKLFESMWGQGGFIDEIGGIARAPEAFKADAIKTMLKQMEDNRGRFILVVADYADRVNDFLNIDPGISRRFGHRFSLSPLGVEGAVASLGKQLAGKEMKVDDEVAALIARRMQELHDAPEWASSGDVRKLLNSIITQQKTAFLEARAAGEQVDPRGILPVAVNRAFDGLLKEKMARTIPTEKRKVDEMLQSEMAKATQKPTETKTPEDVQMDAADREVLDAQAAVDQEFAAQVADDPALQQRMEGDVNSPYIRRLAQRLRVTPEEALKSLQKVKVKVKKMVTNERLVKRFEYHCPYCGGINSPRCAYIGESLEWKIQHSLKKPWTEVVRETKEVEVEQDGQ